jgi:hypothetical protein
MIYSWVFFFGRLGFKLGLVRQALYHLGHSTRPLMIFFLRVKIIKEKLIFLI